MTIDVRDLDVAIIGMAGRFPGARDIESFWSNTLDGIESLSDFSREDALHNGIPPAVLDDPRFVNRGAMLDESECFDAELFRIGVQDAALLDPQHRLFLEACWIALEYAGYPPDRVSARTGVFGGCGLSQYGAYLSTQTDLLATVGELRLRLATDKDFFASRVAYKLGLTGPAVTVQAACATSLVAVHMACRSLIDGECDSALAGAAFLSWPQHVGYLPDEGSIFSVDGHCRPFDSTATGTIGGNGVGVVVLKRLEDALADKDTIYAVIRGSAMNNDGSAKVAFTAPSADAQANVVAEALAVAEVSASEIGFIEAHGTGTPVGDAIELEGLHAVFQGVASHQCALGSVKANIGHLDAAAGVAGLIRATLAVSRAIIPPMANFSTPSERLDAPLSPFRVPRRPEPWSGRRLAGVSAFGMGGTNVHVVIEAPPPTAAAPPPLPTELVLLSAQSGDALTDQATQLAHHLEATPQISLTEVAHTLQMGRARLPITTYLLANDRTQLLTTLRQHDALKVISVQHRSIILLFPGQGEQVAHMGLALSEAVPPVRQALRECSASLRSHLGMDAFELLTMQDLSQTMWAQPALFAVQYALGRALLEIGVQVDGLIGHSIGEYAVACLAGVLSLDDAIRLVVMRGRLMQAQPKGSMLVVQIDHTSLAELLPTSLEIAAFNAPDVQVVAGPDDAVASFAAELRRRQIVCRTLIASNAFHTQMMKPAAEALEPIFARTRLHAPNMKIFSGLTGTLMSEEQATNPTSWARQIYKPVRFAEAVLRAAEIGPSLFVEVGPGRALTSLARRTLASRNEHLFTSILPHPGDSKDLSGFLVALAQMWISGASIDWTQVRGGSGSCVLLPSYPFRRNQYWLGPEQWLAGSSQPLPSYTIHSSPHDEASETPLVEKEVDRVNEVWKAILGTLPRHEDEEFFDAGGDSLSATRLVGLLRERTGVHVTLATFYACPTIRGLREALKQSPHAKTSNAIITVEPERCYEPFPMLDLQHAYWVGRGGKGLLDDVGPQIYFEYRCEHLDVPRLEHALRSLISRHEALRLVALPDGQLRVLPDVPEYIIEIEDLHDLTQEACEIAFHKRRESVKHTLFDPHQWPLFAVQVTRLEAQRYHLHLKMDYLITDATSISVFLDELASLYMNEDEPLPPIRATLRDCSLAYQQQRSLNYQEDWSYWREVLPVLPPSPHLPTSMLPETAGVFQRLRVLIPEAHWMEIKRLARQNKVSPSATLCAAYGEVLSTWSNAPTITLNLTLANRLPLHPDVAWMMGEFTSTTLVPFDGTQQTFGERVRKVMIRLTEALEHPSVSGIELLREMPHLQKLEAPVIMPFVFTSLLGRSEGRALAAEGHMHFESTIGSLVDSLSMGPQLLIDNQVMELDGQLEVVWDVRAGAFPDGLCQRLFDAFTHLIDLLASSQSWEAETFELRSEEEQLAVALANDTDASIPPARLETLFMEQRTRSPLATAIITADRDVTYTELETEAAKIEAAVRAIGIGPEEPVAILLPRGWQQIACVLGVLAANAAYLPLALDWPKERILHILRSARVRCMLSNSSLLWNEVVPTINVGLLPPAIKPLTVKGRPNQLAYIIYTSGSTGTPKGVAIEHQAAVNTILDINKRFSISAKDRVMMVSSLTFDLSVYDIFGTLAAGGTIVVPDTETVHDPDLLADWIVRKNVTVWNSVPALFDLLVAAGHHDALQSLRLALLSGDWVPVDLAPRANGMNLALEVVSLGGATEAAIWSIAYPITKKLLGWPSVPYGRPLSNQRFVVLNHRLQPCPEWVPGELFIVGKGLAREYYADLQKTQEKFLLLPDGDRLYRTGDLGRWRPGGLIELLGRVDTQVKLRGFRIELTEIEHIIEEMDGIHRAIASVESYGDARTLVLYYQVFPEHQEPSTITPAILQDWAARYLPEYMVPSLYLRLETIPLNTNGKVDRTLLHALHLSPPHHLEREPKTEMEASIDEMVMELLGLDRLNINASFFSLGGDSLTATRLLTRLREEYSVTLSLRAIYDAHNLAEIALLVEDEILSSIEAEGGQV